MKFLVTIIRYIHYTLGITTPRPEEERKVVAIWVISTLFIIAVSVGFLFLLTSKLLSTR
jgi:hypothetical protein